MKIRPAPRFSDADITVRLAEKKLQGRYQAD
jgi:hypothetical protein